MFYEYALDPAALKSWERVRFFLDASGPWNGRFIARFPKSWKRLAYQALDDQPRAKLRAVERLDTLDDRVFSKRPGAGYNPEIPWFPNATVEDARLPFHVIVSETELSDAGSRVLNADDVSAAQELWRVETGCNVDRSPSAMIGKLTLLLRVSSRIAIVDPFFNPSQHDKARFIAALCEAVGTGMAVEVHSCDRNLGYSAFASYAHSLPRLLRRGLRVNLTMWHERIGGRRFHNRYLLTDVGGVQFGDSIEAGAQGEDDHISIIREMARAELWDRLYSTSPAFDLAGPRIDIAGGR